MIVPQVRRRAARGRRPGRPLFLGVIVLALGPLNDLVRLLVEVKACASRKEGQRDRRSDHLYSPSACHCSHASPPAQRDSRPKPWSTLMAPYVKSAPGSRLSVFPDRTAQIRATAPKTKHGLRLDQGGGSALHRFGKSTTPSNPARIAGGVTEDNRDPRASSVFAIGGTQFLACMHQQASGKCSGCLLLLSRGVASFEAWLRSRFARRRSCGPPASWRLAPGFAVLLARRWHARSLGTRLPCCSTKWSADSPKCCSAWNIFQRTLRIPS